MFLGDYTGASLHILAGGSVTLDAVTITGTGVVATTINPNNTGLPTSPLAVGASPPVLTAPRSPSPPKLCQP